MNGKAHAPAGAGASLRLRVPPEPRYSRRVRERVASFVAAHAIAEPDLIEFVTAVSEALANAIEHSHSQDTIEITCWIANGNQLVATIVDHGIGFVAEGRGSEPALPEGLAERGRGLPIMRRFTDRFSVLSTPGKGTSVTLSRFVRRHDYTPDEGAA